MTRITSKIVVNMAEKTLVPLTCWKGTGGVVYLYNKSLQCGVWRNAKKREVDTKYKVVSTLSLPCLQQT